MRISPVMAAKSYEQNTVGLKRVTNFTSNGYHQNSQNIQFGSLPKISLKGLIPIFGKKIQVKNPLLELKNDQFFLDKLLEMKAGKINGVRIYKPTGDLVSEYAQAKRKHSKLINGNVVVINAESEPLMLGQIVTLLELKASKAFNAAEDASEIVTMPKEITQEVIEKANNVMKEPVEGDIGIDIISVPPMTIGRLEEEFAIIFGARLDSAVMTNYTKKMGIEYQVVK